MNAQQLKNAILQEAIEGRLVPQDPNDEPASVLLERIRAEKERLVKEGKLKKKDLEVKPISEDEIPFEIPDSWEWVRLGLLVSYQNGYAYNSSEMNKEGKGMPVIKSGNLMTLEVVLKPNNDYVEHPSDKMLASKIVKGDMLMCLSSQSDNPEPLGKTAVYNFDTCALLNQRVLKFRPYFDELTSYLFYTINSFYFWYNVSHQGGGSAQANLKLNHVLDMPIPLPPFAEQQRIVVKIEELLPIVKKYGKAQDELNKLNEELPERLKKSILQEAIEGRLVPQDPNDEPASVLLQKIREEKKQLVKEGKLKKKDLEEKPISEDEVPFEIPESWEWVRMQDVITFVNGRAYKQEELLDKGKYKVLRVGNFFTNDSWYYSDMELPEEKYCYKHDLLYAWSASFGPKIWEGDKTIFHYHIWNVKYNKKVLFRDYLFYFFLIDKESIKSSTTGSTMIHVSMENMKPRLIPIPPLAEQKRIVAKIEKLLQKVGGLKI